MSAPLKPPKDAVDAQTSASDPSVSAWVSANAGSGKTRVLTDRVVRLLLHGCEPSRILCLTYTKAAAANMANRVFGTLGRWTRLDDQNLAAEIRTMEGDRARPHDLAAARRLFARALECPGGLKVQTIHAFSERLLHLFPFEAKTPASFSVLDEAEAADMLAEARMIAARDALNWSEGPLGKAGQLLGQLVGERTIDELLAAAIVRRHDIEALFAAEGGLDGALRRLALDLDLSSGEDGAAIESAIVTSDAFPQARWQAAIAALEQSSKMDQTQADRLRTCLVSKGAEQIDAYISIFLTRDGEPRAQPLTRAFSKKNPDLAKAFAAEGERLVGVLERRHAIVTHEASGALLTMADAVIAAYARLKRGRAKLDFDDLVYRVRRLLSDQQAAWALYKLDEGIDHILIDEAQDTSPAQWEIVESLGAEFFVGESARRPARTMFAVGDEKQSIYSFQGAQPKSFDEMRRRFERRARDAKRPFREVGLVYSFRSTEHVLGAVDRVFARPEALNGLTAAGIAPIHQAVRVGAPGFVEVWELIEPQPADDGTAWDAPFDARNEQSPVERLAQRIAATVRKLIEGGEARPGEILILVQRRNALFEGIIRSLKAANVAVAGADRLKLNEHIAVMDCLAAADFALLPDDDLTLAAVLKSPLIGLDEEALFNLAHAREGSLWRSLNRAAGTNAALEAVRARLAGWLERADFVRPFEFFSEILAAEGGRRRLLSRLGPEAGDALDELLNLALAYEDATTPSLQGFVWRLRATEHVVKRTLDVNPTEVQVMTVHNAKGLEAPIVFLADTLSAPESSRIPKLTAIAPRGRNAVASALAWRGVADKDPEPVALSCQEAIEAQRAEHHRLLYVAMTRAADRLYVCGHRGVRPPPEGNWRDLVLSALSSDWRAVEWDEDEKPVAWRWTTGGDAQPPPKVVRRPEPRPESKRPAWLDEATPQELPPRPLVASSLLISGDVLETEDDRREAAAAPMEENARRAARERGTLTHRLLQTLPDLDPAARWEAGERFLAGWAGRIDAAERRQIVGTALSLLADAAFAPVFAPGSRAEVPVAGVLTIDGEERPVSGVIDRLAILPDRILIVDFKTTRDPPEKIERTPRAYLAQLAAYRRLLMRVYPDRPAEAALLWTAAPRLMAAPSALLDGALSADKGGTNR